MHARTVLLGFLATAAFAVLAGVALIYGISGWKMHRYRDAPLSPLLATGPIDAVEGERMARIVGCLSGCHGRDGEGGSDNIAGIHRNTAPTLSTELPLYDDARLVRLIRYGVKRDGTSAVGMSAFVFWHLGDQDLANIIAHLRSLPVRPPVARVHDLEFRGRWALVTGEWKVSAEQVDPRTPRLGELPRRTPYERGQYLASLVCAECHGTDFRGNHLEGGPSLAVLAAYRPEQFRQFMQTGKPIDGRDIPKMSWLPEVDLTDRDVADLYIFLREFHGLAGEPPPPSVPDTGLH